MNIAALLGIEVLEKMGLRIIGDAAVSLFNLCVLMIKHTHHVTLDILDAMTTTKNQDEVVTVALIKIARHIS